MIYVLRDGIVVRFVEVEVTQDGMFSWDIILSTNSMQLYRFKIPCYVAECIGVTLSLHLG